MLRSASRPSHSFGMLVLNRLLQSVLQPYHPINQAILKGGPLIFWSSPPSLPSLANAACTFLGKVLPIKLFSERGLNDILLLLQSFLCGEIPLSGICSKIDVTFDSRIMLVKNKIKIESIAPDACTNPVVLAPGETSEARCFRFLSLNKVPPESAEYCISF